MLADRESPGAANGWFERYGAYAVLVARFIPVVSFDAISYAAGLAGVSFRRFFRATTVGMAPATFVSSYPGKRAFQHTGVLLVAFGVVVVAVVVRCRGLGVDRTASPRRGTPKLTVYRDEELP